MNNSKRILFLLLTVSSCALTLKLFDYVVSNNHLMSNKQDTRPNAHETLKVGISCCAYVMECYATHLSIKTTHLSNCQNMRLTLTETDQQKEQLAVIVTSFNRKP